MSNTKWLFAWRELATRKMRSVLTWFGLVVGLLGFGTTLTAMIFLSNDLATNFLQTNPPNFIATAPSISPEHLAIFERHEKIGALEFRGLRSGKIQVGEERWMKLLLFIVEDFNQMNVAKIYAQNTSWPPPEGTLVLERSGNVYFDEADGFGNNYQIQPGTQGSIEIDGKVLQTPVHGFVFDPAQAPSPMERLVYGYISVQTCKAWNLDAGRDRLLATLQNDRLSTARAWQVVNDTRDSFKSQGLSQLDFNVPNAGEHPHQFQLTAILALISGLALLAFFLCAILVVNLTGAILMNKLRQIAILRALGGRKSSIIAMLLGPMAMLGILTSAFAVPMSLFLGRRLAFGTAQLLNFDLLTASLPVWIIVALTILGICLPMGVAFWPVRRTVQANLGNVFRDEAQFTFTSPRKVYLAGWLPTEWLMSLRNLSRRRARTLWTVLTLTIGLAFFISALNVRASLLQTIQTVERSLKHDLRVSFADADSGKFHPQELKMLPEVHFVESWHRGNAKVPDGNGNLGNSQTLFVIPTDQKALQPNILQGTWLNERQPMGVVVNQTFLMAHPDWKVGNWHSIVIQSQEIKFELLGVVKEFNGGSLYILKDALVSFPSLKLQDNQALVGLHNRELEMQRKLAKDLEALSSEKGWSIRNLEVTGILVLIVKLHLDVIAIVLGLVAVVMLGVGALGMASGVSIAVAERVREIGVMRAMGASRRLVLKILFGEALVMALLAWVLAMILADPLSRGISEYFGTLIVEYPFDFTYSNWGILSSCIVASLLACFSSLFGAWPFINKPIADVLRST